MTGVSRELRWALSRGAYDEENAWGAGLELMLELLLHSFRRYSHRG